MATPKKQKRTSKKKAATNGAKSGFGDKTRFVRKVAIEMPAKQVIEEAKKAGLKISENHVYAVRAVMRKEGAKGGAKAPSSTARASAPASSAPTSSLEQQLRRIVAELGLARSRAVMADVEAAFTQGKI